MSSVYVIAEAGVNHNGSKDIAFQLVDVAVAAGADAVKFQTYKTKELVTRLVPKANYQEEATTSSESQFDMLEKLELSYQTHHELLSYCNEKKIDFISTAFDFKSLNFLVNNLSLKKLKISSGDITNGPLLLAYAQTGCDLILSTGMSTLAEVEEALSILAFGFMNTSDSAIEPCKAAFQSAFFSKNGQANLQQKVSLLHCTTEYPADPEDINLNAMHTLHEAFGLPVGYSDHSKGITVPVVAVTMDAKIIEKHFTLDNALPGPDHKASLNPDELSSMIQAIRISELVKGKALKIPTKSELKNRFIARKNIVAATPIKKGDYFTEDNMAIKRSGSGISPMNYWILLNLKSDNDYDSEDPITENIEIN